MEMATVVEKITRMGGRCRRHGTPRTSRMRQKRLAQKKLTMFEPAPAKAAMPA